jgi:integrase
MTTITDSVTLFLTQRGYRPNTTESYLHWVRRLESHFPDRDISSLAPEDVASFFQHLQARRLVGAQSVRQATSAIRFMFREILRRKDLADVVPKIKLTRPQASIPTQQEILSVIEKVNNKQLQTALKCMYGMGLELQDVRSLKVKHIDFQAHKIHVQSQRSKVVRWVPIPRFVLDDLRGIAKASSPDQFIFPSKSDGLLGEQMLQRAWRAGQRAANVVGNYSLRSLRHAYIRHLELLGVPLKDVLHHLGVHKARALEYYSSYGAPSTELTFSPADRMLYEGVEQSSLDIAPYVSEQRLTQLSEAHSPNFDFTRLLALLYELNSASRNRNYLSIAFLVRAVIDHVPPIFEFNTFGEVANNYQSTKSFKKHMEHLHNSLRNVADGYLHVPIRSKEDLPHFTQVDFRSPLDQLLGEVVRVLKKQKAI